MDDSIGSGVLTNDTLSASYTVDDSADSTPTQNPFSLDVESLREQVTALREAHVLSPSLKRPGLWKISYGYLRDLRYG